MIRIRLYQPLLTASGQTALEVDLRIRPNEFLAVTGPSGSGKTTLLRFIAGLARPVVGRIEFGDERWLDTEHHQFLPPQARRVGMVFQDYALFPNLTVQGNLTYPLERGQSPAIVKELVAIMELEELIDRYPNMLSGGQQQRVALARALVRRPNLLLLDEPLSALDAELRAKLQDYIRRVHERFELTTILVSHNPEDVRRMADRVLRLENGRITWQGKPAEAPPETSGLKLKGVIRSLDRNRPVPVALIAVGVNTLEVELSPQQAAALQPDMEVTLTLQAGRPSLNG